MANVVDLGADRGRSRSPGNELELLQFKGTDMVPEKCVRDIWENGYLWRKFRQYVAEFDAMGFGAVPITSVFTGLGLAGVNFYEVPGKARVGAFLANATEAYASRFAFTWNFYPYFDPNMRLDAGTTGDSSDALRSLVPPRAKRVGHVRMRIRRMPRSRPATCPRRGGGSALVVPRGFLSPQSTTPCVCPRV